MKDQSDRYVQCELSRVTDNGTLSHVAYIPEKLAVKGKFVELKNDDGEFDGFRWEILFVSDKVANGKYVQRRLHDGWNNNI